MRFKSRSRALAASALAASLALSGLALTASPVNAEPAEIVRVSGATRYGTAAAAAVRAYPEGATNVVLASGEAFPDALSAGGFAGSLDAPILLTPSDRLDDATIAGLEDLGAETVYVMGGTAAVSEDVVDALEEAGYTVVRVAGDDRFETAAETAAEIGGDTAVLANGFSFADALAISPGAHALELPIVLTTANEVPAPTAAVLDGVDTVIIVGGTAVVSQEIEDALEADGKTVVRLAGQTRYESAVEIAEFHFENGFEDDELVMATGENFADALAGGPLASQLNAPLVLTQTNVLTPSTEDFIESIAPALDTIYILGGTAAITDDVADAAAEAADEDANVTTNASFFSDADEVRTLTFDPDGTGMKATTVTFDNLDDSKTYDVALFPVNEGGQEDSVHRTGDFWSFRDQESGFDGIADDSCETSDGYAEIVSINGISIDSQCAYDGNPENGELQIRLDLDSAGEADSAYLVIWQDASESGAGADNLNLGPDDRPVEPFGVAGPFLWTSGECQTGTWPYGHAMWVDKDANSVLLPNEDCTLIYGRSGDTFQYDYDYQISLANFEMWLNTGDDVDYDDFAYNRAGNNEIVLDDDYPATPTNVVATLGDFDQNAADTAANDVQLTWDHDPALANMGEDDDGDAGYCIDRWSVSAAGAYSGSTNIGCFTWDDDSATSNAVITNQAAIIPDQPAGASYAYTVYAYSASDDDSDYSDPSNATTAPPASATNVTGAPVSTSASVTDADSSATLNAGDVLSVTFNELMAAPNAGDTIEVTDADGTVANITNGLNSTWELAAGNRIVITMTAGPSITTTGSTTGVQYPATATASSGVTDADEANEWDIASSTDDTF